MGMCAKPRAFGLAQKGPFAHIFGSFLILLGGCSHARAPAPIVLSSTQTSFSPKLWRADVQRNAYPIAIDPGHGGYDTGAKCLHRHLLEKKLNLEMGIALRTTLAKRRFSTMLSRQRDVFVSLDERARRANSRRAILFVSIHQNWALNKSAQGIEIFYPTDSANPQRAHLSQELAQCILSQLKQRGFTTTRGVKPSGFRVLRRTRMPAVLVECGFLSNLRDLRQLGDPKRRRSITDAIAEGVDVFLKQKSARSQGKMRSPTAAERLQPQRASR